MLDSGSIPDKSTNIKNMKFPSGNKIHRKPVPEFVKSNIALLEEHLSKTNWKVFARAYVYVSALLIGTVFCFILAVGFAKWLVSLLP